MSTAASTARVGWNAAWPARLVRRHGAIVLAVLPFFVYWLAELSRYAVLADPLHGGDGWQQLGIATHIYRGHAVWTDAYFAGEFAFRDPILFVLVAALAKLFAIEPLRVAILLPAFWLAASGIVAYALGFTLMRSRALAILLAAFWMGIAPRVAFQSSSFAASLMVPLFLLALASQDGSLARRAMLGLAWAGASLSYLVAFFGTSLMIAILLGARLTRPRAGATFGSELRHFLPIFLVAAPFILALWGPILFAYHGQVLNPSHLYAADGPGWSLRQGIGTLASLFLFRADVPVLSIVSLAAGAGIFAAWRQRETHGGKWVLLLLLVGLIGTFHYLVTMPLVHTHLVYFRWPKLFLDLAQALLALQTVALLARSWRPRVFLAIALVAVLVASAVATPAARSDLREEAQAPDARLVGILEAGRFVRANVPPDAVFLALDQEAFILNGVTGAHVVAVRRSHANTFVDADQRIADLAIMIYGADRAFARALMDEYGVTHAYVGPAFMLVQRELPLLTAPRFADHWRAHGVPFEERLERLDPYGDSPRFPSIVVSADAKPLFMEDFTRIHHAEDADGIYLVVAQRG